MKPIAVGVVLVVLLFGADLAYGMGGGGGGAGFGFRSGQTSSGNLNANDGTHAQVATGGSIGSLDAVGTDAVTLSEPDILVLLSSALIGLAGFRRTFFRK